MSDLTLRAARPEDVAQITAVIGSAYAAEQARLTGIPDVTQGIDRDIRDRLVSVVECAGDLLGVIVLKPQGDVLWVVNLAVAAAAQGRGIGARLMHHAEATARAADCATLRLRTHVGMRGTRAFYGRLGWVETGQQGQSVSMEKQI